MVRKPNYFLVESKNWRMSTKSATDCNVHFQPKKPGYKNYILSKSKYWGAVPPQYALHTPA